MVFKFFRGARKPDADARLASGARAPERPSEPDKSNAAPVYSAAPGTQISFDPTLVQALQADHRKLLDTYGTIKASYEQGDLARASLGLERLRTDLMGHLLKENVRFYVYLDRMLAGDAASRALIRQFRAEMDAIGKAAMAFLDKYRALGVDRSLAGSFAADLASVGKVLTQRIENEEQNLYPLYMPPAAP